MNKVKFKVNLERRTLCIEGDELALDDSLFGSSFEGDLLTLQYGERVHEKEMDKIDYHLRTNYPNNNIQVDGGELDEGSQVAIYGDITPTQSI